MSYLLSPDVTDPNAYVTMVDPGGVPIEKIYGGVEVDQVETIDGVTRLLDANGRQLEQYPNQHGSVRWVEGRGGYGCCDVEGVLVAFKTRPGDQAFVYTLKRLPA